MHVYYLSFYGPGVQEWLRWAEISVWFGPMVSSEDQLEKDPLPHSCRLLEGFMSLWCRTELVSQKLP